MTLDVDRISRFLLDLYRDAREQHPAAFQQNIMTRLREFIPFEFAIWGGALHPPVRISDVTLLGRPDSRVRRWPRMASSDAFCNFALARASETVLFDDMPGYCESGDYHKYWRDFGVHQVLITAVSEPPEGYSGFIAFCRTDMYDRYSESERRLKQLLTPHMASALRVCREQQLQAPTCVGEGVGLVTARGIVLASRPPFPHLVCEEWPRTAPRIPPTVFSAIRRNGVWRGQYIEIRSERLAPYYLARACACTAFETLTPRERQVAARFASGCSHKQVARELGISPATVRNQIAAIYEKLGVNDKVHLARLIHGVGTDGNV